MCHFNAQSIPRHIDEIRLYFSNNDFDIIAVSETWLSAEILDTQVSLPNFNLIRFDRARHGGGVAIYVKNHLHYSIIGTSSELHVKNATEYLSINIKLLSCNICFISAYRPNKTGSLHDLELFLMDKSTSTSNLILMGDLNADLSTNAADSIELKAILSSVNLDVIGHMPTHHTSHSNTHLDICAVANKTNVDRFGQSDVPFLSGHDLIYIHYKVPIVPPRSGRQFYSRAWSSVSSDVLMHDLHNYDWHLFQFGASSDTIVSLFTSRIKSIINYHIPEKLIINNKHTPGINAYIKNLIKTRDLTYKKFKKFKTKRLFDKYKWLRSRITTALRENREKIILSKFNEESNSRKFWNKIDNLGITKRAVNSLKHVIPPHISPNTQNNYFVNSITLSNFPPRRWSSYTPRLTNSTFNFHEVKFNDIKSVLLKVTTSSVGSDGVSLKHLKVFGSGLIPYLMCIFNVLLIRGDVPVAWKNAISIPAAKVPHPKEPAHFRGIVLLPILSKLLERIVHDQLSTFLNKENLLDKYQTGFKSNSNTLSAVTYLLDDIRLNMYNQELTIAIFFDFSKAFDTVDHGFLLQGLSHYGVGPDALKWFTSYLTGRSQQTVVNGVMSSSLHVKSGVPQGSVLGPLLYSIYVNDIGSVIEHSKHLLFADDLVIYINTSLDNITQTIAKINKDINSITNWASRRQLKLNPNKTQATMFGKKYLLNKLKSRQIPNIIVNNTSLKFNAVVKYLGIHLDESLSWTHQVSHVCSQSYASLHRLYMNTDILSSVSLRRKLISSLVAPIFDYSLLALTDINNKQLSRLQVAFNACVRFILKKKKRDHISNDRLSLGWLSIRNRMNYFVGCLFFKSLKSGSNLLLNEKIKYKNNSVVGLRQRPCVNELLFTVTCSHGFECSLYEYGARLWNHLPLSLTSLDSIDSFKVNYHLYLLKMEKEEGTLIV